MNPRFDYTEKDLAVPLAEFLGGDGLSLENFGITGQEYERVEEAYCDIFNSDERLNDKFAFERGFKNLDHLRKLTARCQVYIAYYYETRWTERHGESLTVDRAMRGRYEKCVHLGIGDGLSPPPPRGNVLEYFESFDAGQLMAIGW